MKFLFLLALLSVFSAPTFAFADAPQVILQLESGSAITVGQPFSTEWTMDFASNALQTPAAWSQMSIWFSLGSLASPVAPTGCSVSAYGQSFLNDGDPAFTMHLMLQGATCAPFVDTLKQAGVVQVNYTDVSDGMNNDLGDVLVELRH